MLKLCGSAISNHYNKVKLALLEKGIAFEEVMQPPSQDAAYLARSPMGKIPIIEVDGKSLAESQAINEYLEDTHPQPPLYPRDPWARAKCREIIQMMEHYLISPNSRVLGAAFFGASVSEETKSDVMAMWERGVKALGRLAQFDPYIAGKEFSYADCAAFPHLQLVSLVSKMIYGRDVLEGLTGCASYLEMLRQRPHCQTVTADQMKAMEAFMAAQKAKR